MDMETLYSILWNMAPMHTIRKRYLSYIAVNIISTVHALLPHAQDGVNPLHIAAFKGHNSIVRYLCLSERVVVDTQDMVGIAIALGKPPLVLLYYRMELPL